MPKTRHFSQEPSTRYPGPSHEWQKMVDAARRSKFLSYADLAAKLPAPATRSWLYLAINGKNAPRPSRYPVSVHEKLCAVLNIKTDELASAYDASRLAFERPEPQVRGHRPPLNDLIKVLKGYEAQGRKTIRLSTVLGLARGLAAETADRPSD